jgi:hypothetical protein
MRLLDHGAREHGQREIVSRWAAGNETRTNWAGVARDARRLANALERLGIRKGRPRGDARDEPQPPSRLLVRHDRHGRRHPHRQSALCLPNSSSTSSTMPKIGALLRLGVQSRSSTR